MRRVVGLLMTSGLVVAMSLVGLAGSALVGGAPGAAAATTVCGRYDTVPLAGGTYIAQNDEWGATDPQCIETFDVGFRVTKAEHTSTHGPAGYPSIYQGCHYGHCSTGTAYPRAVRDLGTITSSWSFTTTTNVDDKYDVPYDIWFDPEPRIADAPTGAELMIWLDQAGGPPPIGTKRDTVTIAGRQWDVWVGTNTVPVISYVLVGAQVNAVTDLPLTDFVADSQRAVAGRARVVDPNWFLTSIEAGFEPWNHGAGMATTSFSITRTCTG